jgi:hypothetical protein
MYANIKEDVVNLYSNAYQMVLCKFGQKDDPLFELDYSG